MSSKVYTKNAPNAIGPYSQAVITGNLVFTSGQIAINPATGKVEATDIEGQARIINSVIGVTLLSFWNFYIILPGKCGIITWENADGKE